MMDTLERRRRERKDVCRSCGWGMVIIEHGYECVNPMCLFPEGTGYRKDWCRWPAPLEKLDRKLRRRQS